jgi:hypothetical protein
VVESLEKPDSADEEKERLYLGYLETASKMPAQVQMAVERFIGPFPDKSADAEKMRIYLNDYARLAQRIGGK